jgi:cephalosporin hydroxylase
MESSLDLPIKDLLVHMQNRIVTDSTYFGVPTMKSPTDMWMYQEIIWEVKPDFIVEIGTWHGGSALAFAHIMDHIYGRGSFAKVITIDTSHDKVHDKVRLHPRIKFITGDALKYYFVVRNMIRESMVRPKVLVIEDSAHFYQNTLNVLNTYWPLVSMGSYFIVEDTICGHGLDIPPKPGPYEAVQEFIRMTDNFIIDKSKEAFLITWNPSGFLKRVR